MFKKSFLLGALAGSVLTFVVLLVIAFILQKTDDSDTITDDPITDDPIQYLEKPMSYEDKAETSFKVFQVLDYGALADEASKEISDEVWYYDNTVLIRGEDFYCNQIVVVKNPKRIGTFSYTNNGGRPMTVPVIEGNMQ